MAEKWDSYQCEYQLDGATWGIQVLALSPEDAQRRLRAIGTSGDVRGQVMMNISVEADDYSSATWGWIAAALFFATALFLAFKTGT
jgi:hypothetical protein